MGQAGSIAGALNMGRSYAKAVEGYEKAKKAYEKALAEYRKKIETAKKEKPAGKAPEGGKKDAGKKEEPPKEPEPPTPPKRSAAAETMAEIVGRRGILWVEAADAGAVDAALGLLGQFDVRLVLEPGTDADRVLPAIVAAKVPVVISPVLRDDAEGKPGLAGVLDAAGVPVAIGSGASGAGGRHLVLHAARAVAAGLDRDRALQAITIRAAEVAGVADRVGSLEPGKDADVLLLTGDPLDTRSRLVRVLVDGETAWEEKP
jgi:hypothetical protein